MNEISIDVSMLDGPPAKIMLSLVSVRDKAARNAVKCARMIRQFSGLFRYLEVCDIEVDFDLLNQWVALRFTGDGVRLGAVWGELRRSSFVPDGHPKKGDSSAYIFFRNNSDGEEYLPIFLNFSSSVCRRVKVGTKTVEQDVYETVCGEMMVLDATVAETDMVPF